MPILPVPLSPQPMHAPDGFFSVTVSLIGWIISLIAIGLAIRNTRNQLGERQIPLMGILAAGIFAGQMLNFTIPGGTSGHLLGGALAAILVGPWAAILIMTSVVAIQALLFQDGGLLVMGLNILNMGVVTSLTGYFIYRGIKALTGERTGLIVGGFVAAWASVLLASIFTSLELALSGTSPLYVALPAMVVVHAIIGLGEGVLTTAALSFILAARPDIVSGEAAKGQRAAGLILAGLGVALALVLIAPLASPNPDGLERIAEVLAAPEAVIEKPFGFAVPETAQFSGEAQDAPYEVLPDYTIPLLGESGISTIAAGIIGVVIVFGAAYGAARVIRRREHKTSSP